MKYKAGWSLAQAAMENTIKQGVFNSKIFTNRQLKIIQEVFSDYLMYIWMSNGDTRCNRQGYTAASVLINDYFRQQGDR